MSLKSGSEIFVVTIPVALLVGVIIGCCGKYNFCKKAS